MKQGFVYDEPDRSPPPMLVGLCGAIGSGKSTVGAIMQEHFGFRQLSFAGRLKGWVLDLFGPLGLEYRHVFGTQAEKAELVHRIIGPSGKPRSGRAILEIIGTEGGRAVMPSLWAALAIVEAEHHIADGIPVVLTDARFATEFEAIRAAGGVVWEVVKVGGEQRTSDHVSDREWREIPKDGIIMARAGDLKALRLGVYQLLALGGRRHAALMNLP